MPILGLKIISEAKIEVNEKKSLKDYYYNDQMILPNGKPYLRWEGGKTWLLPTIDKLIPQTYSSYHEPFLGGGSVFFYLNPINKSYLSDTNNQLINS